MAILKIAKPHYNIDSTAKQTVSDTIFDGYLDDADALCSRFGCEEFAVINSGYAGDGLFWWDKIGKPIAITGGVAYTFDVNGTVTPLTGGVFEIGTQVTFAAGQKVDNSGILMIANGARINYTTNGTSLAQVSSPAPQTASHVIYNGLRFIANETNTARFAFSDIDPTTGEFDPLFWAAIENPLTDDARGDNIKGLFQAWDDIAIWGAEGRSIWRVTGGSPPIEAWAGAFCEAGLLAPYSVKKTDNTFYALCMVDEKPAVIAIQANNPIIISLDIEKVLDSLETLDDAIGDLVSVNGQSFYILTFPTEGQTWVYNIKRKEWYQWSLWETSAREAFLFRNFIYIPQWGKHLCQSRLTGKIYEVKPEGVMDDSNIIRTEWQSAWWNAGTFEDKILARLRIIIKRGQGDLIGNDPVIVIRWRDNGRQDWKVERQISVSLGLQGRYEFYRTISGLGMFRSRQFSVILTDPAKLVLVGIEPIIG